MATYTIPRWVNFKKLNLAEISDDELAKMRREAREAIQANRVTYHTAKGTHARILKDVASIWGEDTAYKYMARQQVPEPPDLMRAHMKLCKAVIEAREDQQRRDRQRAYSRSYRQRKRFEFEDQVDSLILEGANEADFYNPELAPSIALD